MIGKQKYVTKRANQESGIHMHKRYCHHCRKEVTQKTTTKIHYTQFKLLIKSKRDIFSPQQGSTPFHKRHSKVWLWSYSPLKILLFLSHHTHHNKQRGAILQTLGHLSIPFTFQSKRSSCIKSGNTHYSKKNC